MKFSKLSQLFVVSTIGLMVATLLAGCQLVTIDIMYVASSAGSGSGSSGQIQVFDIDSESGALRVGAPTISSGGVGPVSLATTGNFDNLYAANAGSNTVQHFSIAIDGSLTAADSITLGAAAPIAIAVNAANNYLYVVSYLNVVPGTTSATLSEYPLSSSGAIGGLAAQQTLAVPGYSNDLLVPTGVNVLANNNDVYVSTYDQSAYNPGGTISSAANPGWVFGFGVDSSGNLTATAGSPYKAGVKPSGITSDSVNRFVYVTDYASNQLIGYAIQTNGTLNFLVNGPFKTGNEPSSVTVDPRGIFIYVSNALDSTVTGYNIALPTGTPSVTVGSNSASSFDTDTQPVAIEVDPALGRFLYTANYLGNSVSGFLMDTKSGVVSPLQATPFPTGSNPTSLAIIPHGNHSVESVTP